jgi:hypothetical protein
VLYIAYTNPASCIEIRTYAVSGHFREHEARYVIPIEEQSNETLGISTAEGMFAVTSSQGVYVLDMQSGECYFHRVVHPVFAAASQRMITSSLIRNRQELILGTAIGCIWNVCPTETKQNRFFATQHVLAITQLFCEPHVISASTINEMILLPDVPTEGKDVEEDFARHIPAPRPMSFLVRDRLVICLSKYGSVIVFDAANELEPSVIRSPEAYQTKIITPWYPGLCLSPGEGKLLSVLYPDGRVRVLKLK